MWPCPGWACFCPLPGKKAGNCTPSPFLLSPPTLPHPSNGRKSEGRHRKRHSSEATVDFSESPEGLGTRGPKQEEGKIQDSLERKEKLKEQNIYIIVIKNDEII